MCEYSRAVLEGARRKRKIHYYTIYSGNKNLKKKKRSRRVELFGNVIYFSRRGGVAIVAGYNWFYWDFRPGIRTYCSCTSVYNVVNNISGGTVSVKIKYGRVRLLQCRRQCVAWANASSLLPAAERTRPGTPARISPTVPPPPRPYGSTTSIA